MKEKQTKMAPRESDALLGTSPYHKQMSLDEVSSFCSGDDETHSEGTPRMTNVSLWGGNYPVCGYCCKAVVLGTVVFVIGAISSAVSDTSSLRAGIHNLAEAIANETQPLTISKEPQGTGPYQLVEAHKGKSFFDYYEFNDGPDSIGSAGYNTYVSNKRAEALDIMKIETDDKGEDHIYLSSKSGTTADEYGNRFRESIRLEGKRRFDHGLILLDVSKMPTGCGVWPAFWTTDEAVWPDHGEIDIVEPINTQSVAKTALHTSEGCDMYAHVPRWNWTGSWDTSTGLPDTYTGLPDLTTTLEADNCWTMTPHQWANQGCVAVHQKNNTIGEPMNENGGGIYALEWDPMGGHIRSWVFPRAHIPSNIKKALASDNELPDPRTWPTPYAYFAIGESTGCPSDHFQNHRLVLNLAFCGAVAGNRFAKDCPALYEKYNVGNDSVASCNAYLESDEARELLDESAYWKIKGVYLYQRQNERK